MSELNEELLNDVDDYPDLGDADEEALLQDDDDGDVLQLVPEEELGESLDDSRVTHLEQDEDTEETHREKFSVERQRITAPEPTTDESNTPRQNNRFPRGNLNRGFQRGRVRGNFRGRGRFSYEKQIGRNKTVLINPRFQGVVHVNNNARLAWDTPHQQQYQPTPWASGNSPSPMGRPMQPFQGSMAGSPMPMHPGPHMQQPMHSFHAPPHMQPNYPGPPMQPMHQESPMQQGPMPPVQNLGPPGHQLQYIPPPQQTYMPQPLPPGVQQPPIQNHLATPYWDGQNQYTPLDQGSNQPNPFMQNNYQQPIPVMMNQSPQQAPTPNFQMYNQQGNMSPMPPQNYPNLNFTPPIGQVFPNNNNPGNMHYNQGQRPLQNRRELFTQKRKVMTPGFPQNKKVYVQERLGSVKQTIKKERPSVVKEVTVVNVTTVKMEEDEETTDLRLKIEEQKRKREAIIKWKEKRRLEMLGQSQDTPAVIQQVTTQENNEPQSTPIRKPVFQQVKQIVQPIRQAAQPNTSISPNQPIRYKKPIGNNIVITNGYSRKFTKYQQKKVKQNSRVVLSVPTIPLPVPEPEIKLDKKHLSSFLADRRILTKDDSLMTTRKVVIKNISTSTGDKKIFQISKSIGEVQKLHRDKNARQATITFKSVASAHAFFKKYQRHMLDLSMIEVSLCPMGEADE